MRITDALYGEHGSLYTLMNAIEGRLAGAELAELQTSAALFEAAILAHAHFENDPFFAALDRVMPGGGPVTAMRAEHEEIEGELAKVADEPRRRRRAPAPRRRDRRGAQPLPQGGGRPLPDGRAAPRRRPPRRDGRRLGPEPRRRGPGREPAARSARVRRDSREM